MDVAKLWESYKGQRPVTKSLRVDDSRFTRYLEPALGKKEPCEIVPLDVTRIRTRVVKGHSPQTVKHILVLLKRIANYGIEKSLCTGLPFKVKPPKVDNREKPNSLRMHKLNICSSCSRNGRIDNRRI